MGNEEIFRRGAAAGAAVYLLSAVVIGAAGAKDGGAPSVDRSGLQGTFSFGVASSDGEARLGRFEGDLIILGFATGLLPAAVDNRGNSAPAGAGLGWIVQSGRLVGGIEAFDLEREPSHSRIGPNPDPQLFGPEINTTPIDGFARRRRGGDTVERNLFYATAGLAAADVRNDFRIDPPGLGYSSPGWSADDVRRRHVLGLGIGRHMAENWSFRTEVMHVDLSGVRSEAIDAHVFRGQELDHDFRNDGPIARLGVSFPI